MHANNILSLPRFGAYFKKHFIDNLRFYFLSVVVLGTLMLLLLLIVALNDSNYTQYSDIMPFYMIGLYGTGLIFTSLSFGELANKPQGIDYLMLPASHLEKFLTTLLVTIVGFMIVYHVAFFAAVKVLDTITALREHGHLENDLSTFSGKDTWHRNYFVWFVVQSILMLGAVYFPKFSFIKTAFCLILFVLGLYFINAIFAQLFFHSVMPDWRQQFPFAGVFVIAPQDPPPVNDMQVYHRMLVLPGKMIDQLLLSRYFVPPMLWTIAYFRLRDKEI